MINTKLACTTVALTASLVAFSQQRKQGSPLDHLPANIEILTRFGERADFSPDNKQVAFMTKSFGDAMVIDLKTRDIRCLTCNIPAAAFLRVMHLVTGDYILIGPEKFENINISRSRDNELWFLSKKPGSKPVRLGVKMSEGMAISKKSLKIAYTQLPAQDPTLAPDASRLVMAEIDLSDSLPKIINKQTIYESKDNSCTLEAQDFFDNDSKMTFICYEPDHLASVMTIDLVSKAVVNQSKKPGSYNECEGILPDGKYTLVEGDRHCETMGGKRGPWNIDIYKLRLDGTGTDYKRLTHFNDYEGGKASNPVASTDGKYMAFQFANTTDPAGVGYGLLLYKF
jgi:Tol biopolymer transport system component